MRSIVSHPLFVFLCCLAGLWSASRIAVIFRRKFHPPDSDQRDLDFVIGANLTLLSLLIGFSFSMAINRYDQRKNYEEEEANAIGTEYVRAELLPQADASAIKSLLVQYTDLRIGYYRARSGSPCRNRLSNRKGAKRHVGAGQGRGFRESNPGGGHRSHRNERCPEPAKLHAGGMAQRLPISAWGLMTAISIVCSALIGYSTQRAKGVLFLTVPLAVSISFTLIADIDSPRHGLIRIVPQNLVSLRQSISPP